jgi:hypothetical protein
MLQATQSWHGDYFALRRGDFRGFASGGRFLGQAKVRSVFVKISDVIAHQPVGMPFVENNIGLALNEFILLSRPFRKEGGMKGTKQQHFLPDREELFASI